MKYRIKKVTNPSGFELYTAQAKRWFWWREINSNGELSGDWCPCDTFFDAEVRISRHILNNKKSKVEYFQIKFDEK